MNKKGFVTSALLYGILSLFLVLILGTVAIIGNRKITNDKVKQSALDDVQSLTTDESCFTTMPNDGDNLTITDYNENCSKTVYIPTTINNSIVDEIGDSAFRGKKIKNITIRHNIKTIYYNAFSDNENVLFIIKSDRPSTGVPEGLNEIPGTIWGATSSSIRQD